MTTTAYKKISLYQVVCVVEAYFLEPTRLIIVAYNNVKSMFLAVVGRKNTELQELQRRILYNLYTYLIYRLNSTFFLRCKRYFQLEIAAIFSSAKQKI